MEFGYSDREDDWWMERKGGYETTFEYEGEGIKTIRKGDAINQRPGIVHREIDCSPDFEVLEIVAPADFKTKIVDNPK